MKRSILTILFVSALAACAPRPDPRLQAAQDFQQTVFDLVARDEEQSKKLASLRIGMSDEEALRIAGPPSRREAISPGSETPREVWTYDGQLKQLGVLVFERGQLTQVTTR